MRSFSSSTSPAFTTIASAFGAFFLLVGAACDDAECAPGEISAACPAEPESAPNTPAEPEVSISAPPQTCAELGAEFGRLSNNISSEHDRCLDDTDCVALSPQYLCGDDASITTCPVTIAADAQAAYLEELGAYSRALCQATGDLACRDVDDCRQGAPFCDSGRCAFLEAPQRACDAIESDFVEGVQNLAEDGRNQSAIDNCALRTETLICDGALIASACPVAISPSHVVTYEAALVALKESLCADVRNREFACPAPDACDGVYTADRDGLQCVAVRVDAGCPAPEVLLAEGTCAVEGEVCDIPCDANCNPESCGFTATCTNGNWDATPPAPPRRCNCPEDLSAAVGSPCSIDPNDGSAPPSRCTDACTDIRCVTDTPDALIGTWAFASTPGICDICVNAREGEVCTVDDQVCSGPCNSCSFCNLLRCSPGGAGVSTWVRLEVPPENCDVCPPNALPNEGEACAVEGQRCQQNCSDSCDANCREATCQSDGWSAPATPLDDGAICQCPSALEEAIGDRCDIEGTRCADGCDAITCSAFGRWRTDVPPAACAACPADIAAAIGTACTDEGLVCDDGCLAVVCTDGTWADNNTCTDGGPVIDGGTTDAGTRDAGKSDAGEGDAGVVDGGTNDAGASDVDAGPADAGPSDAGTTDAG